MNTYKILSKICFWISGAVFAMVFILAMLHIYLGDRHFDSGRSFFPPASEFMESKKSEFSVALISDTGRNNLVLERILDDVRGGARKHSFILYLGDFVMDMDRTNFYWMLWEIRPKIRRLPMYFIPGNHDVERNGQVDKSFYRSVLGQTYYWFGYNDVLFIGLDSSGHYIEAEQFEWLRETLANVRPLFKHCVIFSHRPPVNPPKMPIHKMSEADASRLAEIIRPYKIDAMFFGHVHYFSKYDFAGVPIYTTPTSGQGSRVDDRYGYISLTFDKNGIKKVEPKYVEYTGILREHFELLWSGHILSQKLRRIVTVMMTIVIVSGMAGLVLRRMAKNK